MKRNILSVIIMGIITLASAAPSTQHGVNTSNACQCEGIGTPGNNQKTYATNTSARNTDHKKDIYAFFEWWLFIFSRLH